MPKTYGIANCPECLNDFIKSDPRTIFCSIKCGANYRFKSNKERKNKICEECNEPFIAQRNEQIYCSYECNGKARSEKISNICKNCNTRYWYKFDKRSESKFCSKKCFIEAHKKSTKIYTCIECKVTFEMSTCFGERKKFCSQSCLGRWTMRNRENKMFDTKIELLVEKMLQDLKINYIKQYKIDFYTMDFFIPSHNLIIECDGDYWHSLPEQIARDKRKNKHLENWGYNILRLTESEITKKRLSTMCKIRKIIIKTP